MILGNLKTFLDKTGRWLVEGGASLQEFLGATGNTLAERVSGVAEKTANLAKDILIETPARAAASLTLEATKQKEIKPETPAEKFFLGEEPVKSISERIKSGSEIGEKIAGGVGKVVAPFLVAGSTILDLTPLGGTRKKAAEILAKETNKNLIKKLLIKSKIPEEIAEKFSPQIARTNTREGVDMLLKKIDDEVSSIVSKERGFISSLKEKTPVLKVAGQYIPRDTDELAIKARNFVKENIDQAEKIARSGTDDNAVAIGVELLKHYNDEILKTTDEGVKNALLDKASDVANDLARNLTAQGRAVQAASILGRLTPEGQLRFAAKEIQKYNEFVERNPGIFGLRKKIPELTGEQTNEILTRVKEIQSLPDSIEKAMKFKELQDYIRNLIPSPLIDKIITVWKAGLLTGLKTSGLNIFSNLSHFGTETIKDIPASVIDKITSLFTGKRTLTFTTKGIFGGTKEGIEKGIRYLQTGFDERDVLSKLDVRKVNFGDSRLGKALQKYTDTVFRIIGSEDQPFYYASKLRSLYDQARAEAIIKGLKGKEAEKFIYDLVHNPTDEMIKYATLDAETAVFQNKTLLGEIGKSIQTTRVGEYVVPFARTPSAVATQIINYSPVGAVKTIFENIGKGKFDQRLFSQGLGRSITGTGALALGYLLYKNKFLVLDRPKSEKERELWRLEGRKENSVYDPVSKKFRSIQVFGPAGNLILIGGHFGRALEKTGSPSEAISLVLAGAAKSFSEQTFLKGVNNFVAAITDPERSAESVAGSTLASSIPTIVSDIARAVDTKERKALTIAEKFMARIPGVRESLEPQIDVLGKEMERIGNPLEVLADPTRPSPVKDSVIVKELRRLWDLGYRVSPAQLGDKKGYSVLTKEQNTELLKRAGEIAAQKLTSLLSKDAYWELPDDEKANKIEEIVKKSRLYARVEKVLELTEGLEGEELINKLKELKKSGLMNKEVFIEFQRLR